VGWDLYLVPPEHGDDVGEWLEQAAEEGHDQSEARRHAAAVLARHQELELGGPYGNDYQLSLPEASRLPLEVGLYGNHASISVAYWDLGERTAELAELVQDIVEALTGATGWVPYDPQEDRVIAPSDVRRLFESGQTLGVGLVERLDIPSDEPKRKRRFGLF
jgi:hypothetical protein